MTRKSNAVCRKRPTHFQSIGLSPSRNAPKHLLAAAAILDQEKDKFARIITTEMGKLLRDSVAEIEKCARGCRFYAENGEKFLREQIISSDAKRSAIRYQPLGIVLAIMPWNFPFWQVFRFAAPALMAGNVALLKHASNVPQCALAIEEIFRRAGFSEAVFQTLLIENAASKKLLPIRASKPLH